MRGRGLPRDFEVILTGTLDSLQHSPSAWPGAIKEDFLQEVLLKLRLESGCNFSAVREGFLREENRVGEEKTAWALKSSGSSAHAFQGFGETQAQEGWPWAQAEGSVFTRGAKVSLSSSLALYFQLCGFLIYLA